MRQPSIRMENVEAIHVPSGRRGIREEAIPPLMESIRRLGLQVPLAVRVVDEMELPDVGIVANVPLLVAGRHRLEACRRLGIEAVPVVDFTDEREARLWEISENLHRADLTQLERDEQVAEWIRISAEVSPHIVAKPGRPAGGTRGAARELGVNREDARRAEKVASLPADAKDTARELGLDNNRSAMLAAASKPDPAAELRRIKAEQDAQEAKRRNGQTDRAIATTKAEEFAEWLMARIDLREITQMIDWLEAAKSKQVIAALRRKAA